MPQGRGAPEQLVRARDGHTDQGQRADAVAVFSVFFPPKDLPLPLISTFFYNHERIRWEVWERGVVGSRFIFFFSQQPLWPPDPSALLLEGPLRTPLLIANMYQRKRMRSLRMRAFCLEGLVRFHLRAKHQPKDLLVADRNLFYFTHRGTAKGNDPSREKKSLHLGFFIGLLIDTLGPRKFPTLIQLPLHSPNVIGPSRIQPNMPGNHFPLGKGSKCGHTAGGKPTSPVRFAPSLSSRRGTSNRAGLGLPGGGPWNTSK